MRQSWFSLGAIMATISLAVTGCGTGGDANGANVSLPTHVGTLVPPNSQSNESPRELKGEIRKAHMDTPGAPPFKLIQPKWLPLTGSQIAAALSGNRLTIDEDYEVAPGLRPQVSFTGGCIPTEVFHPDGRWLSRFCYRGPKIFNGRWTVEPFRGGDHLCVEAPDFARTCRFVWQAAAPNRLFMPASVSMVRHWTEALDATFNPYVLTPISGGG